jgi:hypothetical protein
MSLSFTPHLAAPGHEPSRISVDSGLWPLLVVKLGHGATRQELEAYLAARAASLQRREPHVCIIDAREVDMAPPQLRQRYTDWLSEHEASLRQWGLGTAYILHSPAVRMMMSVIRHFGRLTTPFVVTSTMQPAATWAAERLQEAGLAPAATRVRAQYAIAAS